MSERDRFKKAGDQLLELQNTMAQRGTAEFKRRSKVVSDLIQIWREAKQVQLLIQEDPENNAAEVGTPEDTATPEEDTTPGETSTPEDTTTPEEDTTPGETSTPEHTTTPEEDTTPGETSTPEHTTTPEEDTTPGETSTPEHTTTPDEDTTPREAITLGETARTSQPDVRELCFAPKCKKRGRPKGSCTTAIGLPKAKKLKNTRCSPFHTLDIQSKHKLVLGWIVDARTVTEAMQRNYLIGEEDIDRDNIPSQLKDNQVDIHMLRRYFDSEGWNLLNTISDEIQDEEWKCGECKEPLNTSESIACDSCLEWNHLTCIKLKKIPKCKYWYCSYCKV